jgi:CheY-like chemotaxis protein
LLNILINAEQAIIEGKKGGTIRVRSFFDRKKQLLKVEVSDNGQVIPHEIIGKIFDPFFTTKEVGKGTGLGLSTSYGIIKDHDGDIHVTSNKDWTTFTISLPAVEESVELPVKDVYESREIVAHGEPILVVDDEPLIVKLLEDFLRRKGFSVITATTGSQALDVLQSKKVELVISDIKMPQMDGKKFYSEIKASNPALLEKLIFITGDTLSDDTRKFLKNIKGRFLKKPFSFDEIMKLIDSMKKETVQKELF